MSASRKFLAPIALFFLLAGFGRSSTAQTNGVDFFSTWTYYPATAYSSLNPFCSPGNTCYFTDIDVIAGTTTSSDIDVWTSTTIGPAIAANGWTVNTSAQIAEWVVASPSYWNPVTDQIVNGGTNPTARTPGTGVLSYTSAAQGNYFALFAGHCPISGNSGLPECFNTYFPTYNGSVYDSDIYVWDGAPQVNQPSTTPNGYPGGTGTITVTGAYFVDPFKSDTGGVAGVTPASCDSGLSVSPKSWSYNSATGVETVVVSYSVAANATPGAGCIKFDNHFGSSAAIPFTVDSPPTIKSVTPASWNAGTSYPIIISGTNFSPGSTVAVAVAQGSIALSNVKYVNSTEITATVLPANTDITETAVVTVVDPTPAMIIAGQAIANATMPGTAMYDASVVEATGEIFFIDPYLPPLGLGGISPVSPTTIIANLTNAGIQAKGIVTDETSTVVVVYKSSVSSPVSFSAAGGLTLESWNSSFLDSAPVAGSATCPSSTCTVSQISMSGSFYSFVLVQAPKQSSSVSYSSSQISAGIASWEQKAEYLNIYPTPVIFVHGIWGNAASLSTVQSTLASLQPWSAASSDYRILSNFCYSISLPFDIVSDPTGATGCALSAQTALNNQISAVTKTLDAANIVGGRVDLVVHSMGGLVARHFSSTSLYKTARNRMQGEFRTVVTLDTPENGSGLATFLLTPTTAAGTCSQAQKGDLCYPVGVGTARLPVTIPGLVWWAHCGSNPATVLATCMAAGGQPLGPSGTGPGGFNITHCTQANRPGTSPGCGSVASLIPGRPNITVLPSAQIPNSTWVAIGADWQDNNLTPHSLARLSLNTLISAMALAGNPTTTSALGSIDNDVIVTTSSQFWNTAGVQRAEYLQRAHFSLGWAASIAKEFTNYSDDNVTTDPMVATCVGVALMTDATSTCKGAYLTGTGTVTGPVAEVPTPQPVQPETQEAVPLKDDDQTGLFPESDQELAQRQKHLPLLTDRASVESPKGDVSLGNWLTIPVKFAPGKLVGLHVSQSVPSHNLPPQGVLPVKVTLSDGLPTAIQIVPAQLGSLTLNISAVYNDNGYVDLELHLNVVPSAHGLKQFWLDQGGHSIPLVLEDKEQDRQLTLMPTVQYDALPMEIYLDDATQIKLSVEQDEGNPVIRVDKTGLVHALREGRAVIVGDFDGKIDKVTADVYSKQDAPVGYRRVEQ